MQMILNRTLTHAILVCVLTSASLWAGEGLLQNGDFAEVTANGKPVHWGVYERSRQKVAIDRHGAPPDAEQSLRVDIEAAVPGRYGEIVQRVRNLTPDTTYVLAGKLKSTVAALAFFQIKLLKQRKELKRISSEHSTTEWRTVRQEFYTQDADEVQILCRYLQKPQSVGQTAWFAQLALTKAGPPRLEIVEAVTTFHSLGVYVKYRGSVSPISICRVRYRQVGDAEWKQGFDLIPDRQGHEFRGSLFHLEPDTAYELECQLYEPITDPKRVVCSASATARTWKEEVPIGQVRALPAGLSKEPLVIRDHGKPDAWILYKAPEGRTTTIDAEGQAEQAILFENAAYVILENITIRGGQRDCVRISSSHHVRVRRCDIARWGDAGTRREGLPKGLYVDHQGRPINYHAGVRVCRSSSQVVVEDNFIHSPRGTANSWQYGHPMGPQGIILDRTGGNNVVRNNDLIGSETHWWNDAIESIRNADITGGPYRDADIHGNVLAFSNDDGIELDGGQVNVRFWNNWIDKALCGVSCAPNRKGPSYVFRNLIAELGEERGSTGSAFKMGGGVRWSPGISVILHNTIYGPGGGLRSVGYGRENDRGGYVAISRNNLFAGSGRSDVTNISEDPRNDFDYDLTSRGGVSLKSGGEEHAVTDRPRLVNVARGDYRLAAGSPGIDQGCRLPGINDDFLGSAPDMGTFEFGREGEELFPIRQGGLSAAPMRLTLDHSPSSGETQAEAQLMAPPSTGTRWQAHPNSPWLRCVPSSGKTSNDPQTVVLTPAPRDLEMRVHRGAVTFRTDAGLNRTVMIDLKVYPDRLFAVTFEAEDGKMTGGFAKADGDAASAGAYVHRPEESPAGAVEFSFRAPEDGVYFVLARCLIPEPDPGVHDSFFLSMDDGPKRIWDVRRVGLSKWGWCLANARDEEDPCCFRLPKGPHTLTIHSREALTRLDCLAITNSPYAEEPRKASR